MEQRLRSAVCAGIELRFANDPALNDGTRVDISAADGVIGYAAKFGVRSQPLGGFVEVIEPGAFDGVLEQDVVALFNHDPNMPLARTSAGSLRLSVDEIGLRYEFDLADDECSRQVASFINDGRVSQSSFSFTVAINGDRWDRMDDGVILRTIQRVERLYDVAPVTFPAYPDASVALRAEHLAKAQAQLQAFHRREADIRHRARAREIELASFG
ncbi:MAG: HK97 family phage prohead protease [Sandarakinorhabdus sp.]|jgi:hypothetical protein|nr:HK97 family phage prohead protease [Sandarakinorhabdus sp.]